MKGKPQKSMETFYTKVLAEVVAYNQQRMQQPLYSPPATKLARS